MSRFQFAILSVILLASAGSEVFAQRSSTNSKKSVVWNLADKPELSAHELSVLISNEVNRVRMQHGLDSLDHNWDLAVLATNHSLDMAEHRFFSHTNHNGELPRDRALRAKFNCARHNSSTNSRSIGENLFLGHSYSQYRRIYEPTRVSFEYNWKDQSEFAREVVQGWMDSPPHRANLLSDRYVVQGIGIRIVNGFEIYVTQNLC